MNSLAHINGSNMIGGKFKMIGKMKGKMIGKMKGMGGNMNIKGIIESILKKIALVILLYILYKNYFKEIKEIFMRVQCSRYSYPIGMINEIKPFPFCMSFSKKKITKIDVDESAEGSGASGSRVMDPLPHKLKKGSISADSTNNVQVNSLIKIMNNHIQETSQNIVASQKIVGADKIVFPKNEKRAGLQVYVTDDVAEKVYMGEMSKDPYQACSIGPPIINPKNKKQFLCPGESYNVMLPTGVMKYVLPNQISPVYGCPPNIEQKQQISSYTMNISEKELVKKLANKIRIDTETELQIEGEVTKCSPKVSSSVDSGTMVEMETMISNNIKQLINQDVNVVQNLKIEDKYGMCSPPYPFRCKRLASDIVYPQKDGKCNCKALLEPVTNGEWTKTVYSKCEDPNDCKCYHCCQSNQRWIRQSITIESVAKNIAKSSSEIIMQNKISSKVDNSVKYVQEVPARIVMFSFLWNFALLYIFYYVLKYARKMWKTSGKGAIAIGSAVDIVSTSVSNLVSRR